VSGHPVPCGLRDRHLVRETRIRLLAYLTIPLLVCSGFVPNGRAVSALLTGATPAPALERTLAQPAPGAVAVRLPLATLPGPVPGRQLLADLVRAPVVRPAFYQVAWHGETPTTRPDLAASFSSTHPDAYGDWLLTQLPRGAHITRMWATVTAYCPCEICCARKTKRTANGRDTDIYPYGIATDWHQLPLGSRLHVPGYLTESSIGGVWDVDDTGGALRRSRSQGQLHIDVRFQQHQWARRWGSRQMWIYLVEDPVQVAAR